MPSLSVCIPAYNEEATLASAVEQMEAVLQRLDCDYEIIVCDDASRDGTARILRELTAKNPKLRAIFHPENRGVYATFEELYAAATREAVFLLPADMEWPAETLPRLLEHFGEADIVIATRIDRHDGPARALISSLFNLLPRLAFGVDTSDAGAVKLVRTEILRRVEIISHSPFSEAERIVRAVRMGYRIKLVPTVTRRREAGVSNSVHAGVLIASLRDFFRVWRALR